MLLSIGFKVILMSALLLGILAPVRARMVAGRGTATEVPVGPFSEHPVVGLIQPLAQFLDLLLVGHSKVELRESRLANISAAIGFVAPLSAFAVIPFGSRYRLGEWEIDLVVANLEWGIVWLFAAAILALCGSIGLQREATQRVRRGVVGASHALGAALALASLAMAFGTLNPTTIAAAQDQTILVGDLFGPALPALRTLQLPGWGMFLQPVSLLLFVVCALGASGSRLTRSASELGGSTSGAAKFLVRISKHLDSVLVASVVVALFLGDGTLPYVSGSTIIRSIGDYYGVGLATLVCMAIHMSLFTLKVIAVTVAIEPLARRLARASFATSLDRCWKIIIPVSLVNLFVTAQIVLMDNTLG